MSVSVAQDAGLDTSRRAGVGAWPLIVLLLTVLGWTYFGTLRAMAQEWIDNPDYSVGIIVPFAVLWLLWFDRDQLRLVRISPAWSGLAIIIAAQAMRLVGLAALFETAERYSLIVTVAGLVILVGGWSLFSKTKYIILLLALMIPIPGFLHNRIASPLQDLSTNGAVATLELLGITVNQEGHVLTLNNRIPVAVAEACGGLRMLTAFIFVSAVFAYTVHRPRWQKVVVLCSSIPIAILANLLRLVATALLYLWTSDQIANRFFHDFAGWTMMPLAIGLLMLELWIMSQLVTDEPPRTAAGGAA